MNWTSMQSVALAAAVMMASSAHAANFDWKKHESETINLILNNLSWSQKTTHGVPEFTEKTGIKILFEACAEEQFRARL